MRRFLPALATLVLLAVIATALSAVMRAQRTRDAAPTVASSAAGDAAVPVTEIPADPASLRVPEPAPSPSPAPAPAAEMARAGMVVVADPESHLSGPADAGPLSIEQLQALAREEARGLVTVRHADGSESMDHEGRFRNYSVLRAGPGGTSRFQCVHGPAGVDHALNHGTPARPAFEEE